MKKPWEMPWKMLLLVSVFTLLLCGSALADERSLDAGFYEIGSAANVTIVARTVNNAKVTAVTATVENGTASYYENAARLSVDYTGNMSDTDQFVVMLVEGSELPTASNNNICYIDQMNGANLKSGCFDVYPMLPDETTGMTLYITSDRKDFTTITVPLNYAVSGSYAEAPYVLGDVDGNGKVQVSDAVKVLEAVVEKTTLVGNQKLAADVNNDGRIQVSDAVKILEYVVEKITSFN